MAAVVFLPVWLGAVLFALAAWGYEAAPSLLRGRPKAIRPLRGDVARATGASWRWFQRASGWEPAEVPSP